MSKKNKIIFIIIILFTIIVLGLCIYFVSKDIKNKKIYTKSNTNEVEVCTKEGC